MYGSAMWNDNLDHFTIINTKSQSFIMVVVVVIKLVTQQNYQKPTIFEQVYYKKVNMTLSKNAKLCNYGKTTHLPSEDYSTTNIPER